MLTVPLSLCTLQDEKKILQHKTLVTDRDRALRLRLAARAGKIVHTNQGVFQKQPCTDCGAQHKIPLSLRKQAPCSRAPGKRYYSTYRPEKFRKDCQKGNGNRRQISEILLDNQSSTVRTLPKIPHFNYKETKAGKRDFQSSSQLTRSQSSLEQARPKTSRGGQAQVARPHSAATFGHLMPDVTLPQHAKSDVPNLSWKEIFSDSHISSNSSDTEGSDKSVPSMKRDLMREMFAQEEAALRNLLASQKERHQQNQRRAATLYIARTNWPLPAQGFHCMQKMSLPQKPTLSNRQCTILISIIARIYKFFHRGYKKKCLWQLKFI